MTAPITIKKALEIPARTAPCDRELLLAHVLGTDRSLLLAHPEKNISTRDLKKFLALANRRQKNEPLAYLLGRQPFYGLDFAVTSSVLIPRPESEFLVSHGLAVLKRYPEIQQVIDMGTGSGAILIALLKHLSPARCQALKVVGTDSSNSALAVARRNARSLNVSHIAWLKRDLLESVPLAEKKILLLGNLPYLTNQDYRQTAVEVRKFEPKSALLAGPDGLKYYRPLLWQMTASATTWYAIFEIDPCHSRTIASLAKKLFPHHQVVVSKDFSKHERYLLMTPQ